MKFISVIVVFIVSQVCMAHEDLPEIFKDAPIVDLPISVGKSSYGGVIVSKKEKHLHSYEQYSAMATLQKYILTEDEHGIFSIKSEVWSQDMVKSEITDFWQISKIPSLISTEVYVLHTRGASWVLIAKDGALSDFQLSNSLQYKVGADGSYGTQIAALDTMFGEIGLFPYPETDYEKTGIFCSVLTTTLPSGEEKVQIFKRRITPEGKIENKALPEGAHECKLPW